ncbi:MAG: glycoside-pentoside-hexuronide (GPH):cation symporter [Treponema sp.]|jgi:sugar (glycoside-pentoside-hexuronide) transporter|nr:glycoside-pentoside-hexuronide (GPH):cation symporter [Treponema sp.]
MAVDPNKPQTTYFTTILERISYGGYFVGQNIHYIFVISFLMLFLTDYRFMNPAAVGMIFLVARIWDAVNDPLFGVIVDKAELKGGKFKPWVKISTFLIPIAVILMFAMPEGLSDNAKFSYAMATYILFGMCYTVCDVPIFALATAMTNVIQERTLIISVGRFAASIAMVFLSIVTMPIIQALGWLNSAIVLSAAAFILMFPINIFAKERFRNEKSESASIKDILSYLIGNKYLLILYLGNIIASATSTGMTVNPYVAKYMLGGEHMIPATMLTLFGPMIVITFFIPLLTQKIDKFHLYIIGVISNIIFSVIGYFAGYTNIPLFFALAVIRGISYSITMTMMFLFAADCVEYGQYKTGKRAEGITFSIQTFSTKMLGAMSAALAAMLMNAVGYDGSLAEQAPHTMSGLWQTYLLFPVIGLVLCLPVLRMYRLRDKYVQIMAQCNSSELSREEAEKLIPKNVVP